MRLRHRAVYVAGSTRDVERVNSVQSVARAFGCEITFDWTGAEGEIRTDGSWDSAAEKGAVIAAREIAACADADLVILLFPPNGGGLGCWIEMGAALASDAEVWVVGPQCDSVFWQHPAVTRLPDIAEVAIRLHAAFKAAAAMPLLGQSGGAEVMGQPVDILADSKKALRLYNDRTRVPDRFGDDVDSTDFWVSMVRILRRELAKATIR